MQLNVNFKSLRAQIIRIHLQQIEQAGGRQYGAAVVCCTCGNASQYLRAELGAANVLEIGPSPTAQLRAARWYSPGDLQGMFPNRFDATSGHLPMHLMLDLAALVFQKCVDQVSAMPADEPIEVPSGSGESAVIAAIAFPNRQIIAVFDSGKPETKYDQRNLLYKSFVALRIRVTQWVKTD